MNTSSNFMTTSRKILPYEFKRLPNGQIRIGMLTGQVVIVTRDEAARILGREDLTTQRRTMYQAALDWEASQAQQ